MCYLCNNYKMLAMGHAATGIEEKKDDKTA